MTTWLILARHDENGSRETTLGDDYANSMERVTAFMSDSATPSDDDLTTALDGWIIEDPTEFLLLPLDGAKKVTLRTNTTVETLIVDRVVSA